MRVRAKWYEKHGISQQRYIQLKAFAMRYDELREREAALRRGEFDRREQKNKTWRKKDPTGNTAIGNVMRSCQKQINAIEDSAGIAAPDLYEYLMKNVTRGVKYEDMRVPTGRRQFYAARRRFYLELDQRVD